MSEHDLLQKNGAQIQTAVLVGQVRSAVCVMVCNQRVTVGVTFDGQKTQSLASLIPDDSRHSTLRQKRIPGRASHSVNP